MSLSKHTLVNVLWSFVEQLLRKGTAIATTLVLAFLLSPEDFGLVAMLTLFIAVGYVIIDGGTRAAIIREPNISDQVLSSIFYLNLFLGSSFYFVLCLLAPIIADFYQQKLLSELIYVAGLAFVFFAFSVVPNAIMQRNMQFKLQFKTVFPGAVISSLIAVLLAYLGYGVWAIIWQMVTAPLINAALYWFANIWRPTAFFTIDSIRHLVKFSLFVFLENIIKELYGRVYVAAVGKFFLLGTVGLYFFAKKVAEMLVQQLVSAIQQVTFPALSKKQDDLLQLKLSYRKVIQVTTFLVFPILILIAILSEVIFQLFLPEKWLGAAEYLQLMLIIALFIPLHDISTNVFLVKGKSDYTFYFSILMMLLTLVSLYLTVGIGIQTVLIGEFCVIATVYSVKMYFLKKLLDYGLLNQISDFIYPVLLSVMSAIITIQLAEYFVLNDFLFLFLVSFFYILIYGILSWIFKVKAYSIALNMLLHRS